VRTETQRKLERALLRRRLGIAGAVVLALLIGAGIFFLQSQPNRSEREVEATVRAATFEFDPNTGQRHVRIESELDGGKIVLAWGLPAMPPAHGARIVLRERVTWLGLASYQWEGVTR
jgi:hypothetical protein